MTIDDLGFGDLDDYRRRIEELNRQTDEHFKQFEEHIQQLIDEANSFHENKNHKSISRSTSKSKKLNLTTFMLS